MCACVCVLESVVFHRCQSLQSALSYVCGLYSFTTGRLHEAKRQLRETLTIANGSDLNKLTSCSLLLLGQIFMALGNNKVSSPYLTHIASYTLIHYLIS